MKNTKLDVSFNLIFQCLLLDISALH